MLRGGEAAGALFCSYYFEVRIERGEHAVHRHRLAGLHLFEGVLADSGHVEIRPMLTHQLPDIRPADLTARIIDVSVFQSELVGLRANTHRDGLRVAENLTRGRLGDDHCSRNGYSHRNQLRMRTWGESA